MANSQASHLQGDVKMRRKLLITILISQVLLTGCTTTNSPTQIASNLINRQNIDTSVEKTYPAKKPQDVKVYSYNQQPKQGYEVIGVASVYKKNILGVERKDETIKTMMQTLAAKIGGDGLVDFVHQRDKIQASVITYPKSLS
jgi:hypothetical protein